MNVKKIKIPARDGFPPAATLFTPDGDSKGVIQFNSGTGIPQELYKNYALYLVKSGFTIVTFDCLNCFV